jgi:hypothetical protein
MSIHDQSVTLINPHLHTVVLEAETVVLIPATGMVDIETDYYYCLGLLIVTAAP